MLQYVYDVGQDFVNQVCIILDAGNGILVAEIVAIRLTGFELSNHSILPADVFSVCVQSDSYQSDIGLVELAVVVQKVGECRASNLVEVGVGSVIYLTGIVFFGELTESQWIWCDRVIAFKNKSRYLCFYLHPVAELNILFVNSSMMSLGTLGNTGSVKS